VRGEGMEEFVEFRRRIRPELLEKIERLIFKEDYGIDVDELPDITDEDSREFVRKNPELDEYGKRNGLEKMMFAINERMNCIEDSIIEMGKLLRLMQNNLPLEKYLDDLKRINVSMERAALCIQAYEEDKKHG
jgi:hypothetical protein